MAPGTSPECSHGRNLEMVKAYVGVALFLSVLFLVSILSVQ